MLGGRLQSQGTGSGVSAKSRRWMAFAGTSVERRKLIPRQQLESSQQSYPLACRLSETMAFEKGARPLARCLQCTKHERAVLPIRTFTTSRAALLETTNDPASTETAPPPARQPMSMNPELVSRPSQERRVVAETGKQPVASRRRRYMLKQTQNIPFEQLPFQCFQEARKVLQEDRKEKLEQIRVQRERMERLQAQNVAPQDEGRKNHRLKSMRESLDHLKILADINDPMVKKTFEDKQGMSRRLIWCKPEPVCADKPIFRRHEQADLPPPRRQEVAQLQTPGPHAAYYSDECCS